MKDHVSYWTRLGTLGRALRLTRPTLARERWSRDQLEAYQRDRLGALVAHACSHSRFHRERYGGELAASEIELQRLPPVTKAEWMGAFDRIVADSRLRLADVEAELAATTTDRLYLEEYRLMASSGSTGRRAVYVWSRADWLQLLGVFMRPTRALGIGPRIPRTRLAIIGAPDAKHMTFRLGASIDAGVFRTLRLPATMPLKELGVELQRFRPQVLTAYPSVASLLAAEQLAGRLAISPREVCTTSELRTDEMTRFIREAWSVEPHNAYALTETGLAAWTCPEARRLHVCEDSCILEAIDDDGNPVPDGQPGSKLLVTSLLNRTQPVIRLEVSDQLTFAREPCVCGRSFRVIEELHGRADDVLELPGPDGQRTMLHPIHVRSPLAAMREVVGYQIVQRPDRLDIDVVLAAPDESVPGRLAERIGAALRAHDVVDFPVHVRAVDAITREPGVGKLKLVQVVREPGPSA